MFFMSKWKITVNGKLMFFFNPNGKLMVLSIPNGKMMVLGVPILLKVY